jgi:hypothetical protein
MNVQTQVRGGICPHDIKRMWPHECAHKCS